MSDNAAQWTLALQVPIYRKWEQIPATLATRTQLARERLVLPDDVKPAALIERYSRIHPLYLREHAVARPAPKHPRRDYPDIFTERYADMRAAYRDACEALFALNRYAKHESCTRTARATIYDLKRLLAAKLWREDFCVQAYVARSPTYKKGGCFECYGAGRDDDGDPCWKCDGTGVYTTGGRAYWALRFEVDGERYAWHQPATLAPWAYQMGEQPEAAPLVVAEVKPVKLAQRRFAEAKALVRWVVGDDDLEDHARAVALVRDHRAPDPVLDDVPF